MECTVVVGGRASEGSGGESEVAGTAGCDGGSRSCDAVVGGVVVASGVAAVVGGGASRASASAADESDGGGR